MDFYRPIAEKAASISKANEATTKESAIRAYCVSSNQTWGLQVRGDLKTRYGKNQDFVIAQANLSRYDVEALIAALQKLLIEDAIAEKVTTKTTPITEASKECYRDRVAKKDYAEPCEYGHLGCALSLGGRCSDEHSRSCPKCLAEDEN